MHFLSNPQDCLIHQFPGSNQVLCSFLAGVLFSAAAAVSTLLSCTIWGRTRIPKSGNCRVKRLLLGDSPNWTNAEAMLPWACGPLSLWVFRKLLHSSWPPWHGTTAPSEPGPLHYWGFIITLRHTTLNRPLLDEWSVWCTDCITWHKQYSHWDRHPCPWWDSNPQSQLARGRRPRL